MENLSEKDLLQIERFKTGFPWMDIVSPATPQRGIRIPDEAEKERCLSAFEAELQVGKLRFSKFVPASGAASRMFKDLFNKNVSATNKFVENIEKFAFYDKSLYSGLSPEGMVDYTLSPSGLGYGEKPKAVLKFHRYPDGEIRTALQEQLVEANEYARGADGVCRLVITVSPEHERLFRESLSEVLPLYEKRFGVKYDVKLVFQHKWTDTLAVTPDNEPFLDENGKPLHRPGGHGALIYNLSEVDADLAIIKNIDNVAVDSYLPEISKWKKILIGEALCLRGRIFDCIRKLKDCPSDDLLSEVKAFLKEELCIEFPSGASVSPERLLGILDRPIRVCGMVRNEGEPGGGPFIVRGSDSLTSLQILEGAQVNPDDPAAVSALRGATHFNPVDLVCVLTGYDGTHFDLTGYVDENAGFISRKSYQGRELKALELPGLWNGAMSGWNTMFVEVPLSTFNPVKTVMDLLRDAHQAL